MTKLFLQLSPAMALMCIGISAGAQFSSLGSDPGRVKWYKTETSHYRLIYPHGLDSLAREYAALLERYRLAERASIRLSPEEPRQGKTPVVLHAYTGTSEGAAAWAPRRLDLFTLPEPYDSDPLPRALQLAVHESRHLAQMQFGYRRLYRPFHYLTGEMGSGMLSALFLNQALLEGDALVAETALTGAGRARTADFLGYFKVAFDRGDYRNWYRWRYGSYRHGAPDYDAVGYMTVAGLRYFYGHPLFMQEYFDYIAGHPYGIGNLQKTVKQVSGSDFDFTFNMIMHRFHALWQKEAAVRGPYMPMEQVTFPGRFYTDYTDNAEAEGTHYAFKAGLTHAKTLTRLEAGKEKTVSPFAENTCSAVFDPVTRRFYWSETVPDPRWTLKQTSRIRYMSVADFRQHDLTREGRLYNPVPFADGSRLAAVEYPLAGGCAVVVLSAKDGHILRRFPAPRGIQAIEPAEYRGDIYVLALTEGGYGLYCVNIWGAWRELLPPARQKMLNIGIYEGDGGEDFVEFVSDRDGKNELYRYSLTSGRLFQITNTRYGGVTFCPIDGYLYYSSQTLEGMMVFRTPLDSLICREVSFPDVHRYEVEDAMSGQEKALGAAAQAVYRGPVTAPERYRKLPHLFRFHSWTPFYFNPDEIESLSLDYSYGEMSLGAAGFFQNHLGTASGFIGYSVHRDDYRKGRWRHSAHAKIIYEGLYPVIEATVDFNDRNNLQYNRLHVLSEDGMHLVHTSRLMSAPYLRGDLRLYVPLTFDKGGRSRGLIPQITYGIGNDWFNTASVYLRHEDVPQFSGTAEGRNLPLQSLSASVRGYLMRPAADSQVYPSLGIGAEFGYSGRLFMEHRFTPSAYVYLYGYLPGAAAQQGLRLTALFERQFGDGFGESQSDFIPRGFAGETADFIAENHPSQLKLTADYAVPVYIGDISLFSPVMYIKHFLLTPHVDFTAFRGGNLYSAGASFTVETANLLWLPFSCSWGIDWSCNGGSYFRTLRQNGLSVGRHHLSFVFSVDI